MKIAEKTLRCQSSSKDSWSHKVQLLESFSQSPSVVGLPATKPNNTAVDRRGEAFSFDVIPETELRQLEEPNVTAGSRQRLKQTISTLPKQGQKRSTDFIGLQKLFIHLTNANHLNF